MEFSNLRVIPDDKLIHSNIPIVSLVVKCNVNIKTTTI